MTHTYPTIARPPFALIWLIALIIPCLATAQKKDFEAQTPELRYWDGASTYYTENGTLLIDFTLTDERYKKVEEIVMSNITTAQSATFPVLDGRCAGELFLLEGVNVISLSSGKKKAGFEQRIRVFYNPYKELAPASNRAEGISDACAIRLHGAYTLAPQVGSSDVIISRFNKSAFPIQFMVSCCDERSIEIFVENPRRQAVPLQRLGGNRYSFDAALSGFQNFFTVRAQCEGKLIAEETFLVRVDQEISTRLDTAVIFAVSEHSREARRAGWTDLKYSLEDAQALKWALENKFGFKVSIVENPTWEDINEAMLQLQFKEWGRIDQLFLFFTGHGHQAADGTGYLIPSNAGESVKTYYKMEDLRNQIDRIDCNNITLGIDACFASTFLERGGSDIPTKKSSDLHGLLSADQPFRYFIGSAPSNRKVSENQYLKESESAGERYSYLRKKFRVSEFMMSLLEAIEECESESGGAPVPVWDVGRRVEELYQPNARKAKNEKYYARATRFGSQSDKGFHFIGKNFLLQ